MKLSSGNTYNPQEKTVFQWLCGVNTGIFLALTVFFAYPYFGVRSFFRQATTLMGISIISPPYTQIRTIVYICSLAAGLLLAFLIAKHATDQERVKKATAVSFAWLGFVFEASVGLSIQWLPYDVWMTQNNVITAFFTIAAFLSVVSVLLLTNFRWTHQLCVITSWFALLMNLVILILMARFFVLFGGLFPLLATVMTVNSAIPALNFYRSRSPNTRHRLFAKNYYYRFFSSSKLLGTVLIAVLVVGIFAYVQPTNYAASVKTSTKEVYVGVTFSGNTEAEGKLLIDRVRNFTNVFVVNSWPLSQNETALNTVCNYAVDSGLHIIVYFAWFNLYWQAFWLDSAKQRWDDSFLGIYLYDEPGGIQLDKPSDRFVNITFVPADSSAAANRYIQSFKTGNRGRSDMDMLKTRGIKTFTSDYALYAFDYRAGYDVVFAEFGWNYSRQLNVALVRGAATTQNKDWGVMVTWKYHSAPYVESGDELYNDAVLAYDNGAKYILVFNYPYNGTSPYGILSQGHFDALEKFWQHKTSVPQPNESSANRVAYVLPKDYGYGFRGPNDTVWGVWPADELSFRISVDIYNALQQHGNRLDITFGDQIAPSDLYTDYLYWNATTTSLNVVQ